MGTVILSARMQAVADMVPLGSSVCDVGCDHGYVSIYLMEHAIAERVLAMDINQGPLQRAREHVWRAGLSDYIEIRQSDGLRAFQAGEAQVLICAGMGGPLMQRILLEQPEKTASLKTLILQPQSELAQFRFFLAKMGYSITREDMILEEGKFYPVICAQTGGEPYELSAKQAEFGPLLLSERNPVLFSFLQREEKKYALLRERLVQCGDSKRAQKRLLDLEEKRGLLEEAIADFEGQKGEATWLRSK